MIININNDKKDKDLKKDLFVHTNETKPSNKFTEISSLNLYR